MNALTSELRDLRAELEEATAAHAQEVKRLQEQAQNLDRQRESSAREVSCPPSSGQRTECHWGLACWGLEECEICPRV